MNRSSYYYKPKSEGELNLELMHKMDERYLKYPDYGAPRMHKWLTMDLGYSINIKRVERLYYRVMGLESLQPGRHTTKRNKEHKTYPYLIRNMKIDMPNQVWSTDITYIPMAKGFLYLTAFLDLHSRYVLNWSISNCMDADWCAEVLKETIEKYGTPQIINTDQGSQYTSEIFTKTVLNNGIKLSMDGKGRANDNAHVERLWRTVKYESIYLNPPEDGLDLHIQLDEFFRYYNHQRRHSGINHKKPIDIYATCPSFPHSNSFNKTAQKMSIGALKNY
jgi:putative transposase